MALTADERETVINRSDGDKNMIITTYQKPLITLLLKNPSAVVEEEYMSDGTKGYRFSVPASLLTIRNGSRKSSSVDGKPRRNPYANAAKCGEKKADGTECQMIAKKDTGKCRFHSN